MSPIQELTEEHEAVLLTLSILDNMIFDIDTRGEISRGGAVDKILEFFSVFVDRCHHAKEEKLLFPALEAVGVGREGGPIGVMLKEHGQGRELVGKMKTALMRYRRGESAAAAGFCRASRAYIDLLRRHIEKENLVLFPIANQHLSQGTLSALKEGFARIEGEEIGAGRHEEFHRLLERLEKKYLDQV